MMLIILFAQEIPPPKLMMRPTRMIKIKISFEHEVRLHPYCLRSVVVSRPYVYTNHASARKHTSLPPPFPPTAVTATSLLHRPASAPNNARSHELKSHLIAFPIAAKLVSARIQCTQSKACDADSAPKLAGDMQQKTHTAGAKHELAQVKTLQHTFDLSRGLCLPALGSL